MIDSYPKFRELVNIAIGTVRSKGDFSKEAGLAPAQVSRFLNKPKIPRPAVTTLEKIAKASNGRVSLETLMKACNYSDEKISSLSEAAGLDIPVDNEMFTSDALRIVSSFKKGALEFSGSATRYNSIEDMLDTVDMLYGKANFDCKITNNRKYDGKGHKAAEETANISVSWSTDDYFCEFGFVVYYCKTVGNGVILSDVAFDLQSLYDNNHPLGVRKMSEISNLKSSVISEYQTVVFMRKNDTRIV